MSDPSQPDEARRLAEIDRVAEIVYRLTWAEWSERDTYYRKVAETLLDGYVTNAVAQAVQVKAGQIDALRADLRWAHEEIARLRAEHDNYVLAEGGRVAQAVRAERERCAQTAQDMWHGLIAPADAARVAEALRREPEEKSDG